MRPRLKQSGTLSNRPCDGSTKGRETAETATDRWSAFVAPDLASVFAYTPWLDFPPNTKARQRGLRAREPILHVALEAAETISHSYTFGRVFDDQVDKYMPEDLRPLVDYLIREHGMSLVGIYLQNYKTPDRIVVMSGALPMAALRQSSVTASFASGTVASRATGRCHQSKGHNQHW